MNTVARGAVTVQNNILLVQYSPTGSGIGDLYAIMLSDMKKPLPFQIQRQAPDLQALKGPIFSMSLASVPVSSGSNPTRPGTSPPAPPGSSPGSVNGSGSSPVASAVIEAPPFLDTVLAVNRVDSTSQVWHVRAPGRSVPPGATHDNPLAPLWGSSMMASSFFYNATSVSLGVHTPKSHQNHGILALVISEKAGFPEGGLTKLECSGCSVNVGSPKSPSTQAPSSPPQSSGVGGGGNKNPTAAEQSVLWKQSWSTPWAVQWSYEQPGPRDIHHLTTVPASALGEGVFSAAIAAPSSGEMVGLVDEVIYYSKFGSALPVWETLTPKNQSPNIKGYIIACTTYNDVVIVVAPGSDGTQSRPDIHLYDMETATWAKAQLVPAPPGTFSDIPPIPPPPENSGGPVKGGPDEGGGSNQSGDSSTVDPSPANATTSRAGLIGGIVGGIVVLGALIFAGFFFRRRRGSKQTDRVRNRSSVKPLDSDGDHHNEQRMHDSGWGGRGDGRNPEEMNHHESAHSRADDHHEKTWPSAHNQYGVPLPQAGSPQEMARPQAYGLQEMHLSHADSHQEMYLSRAGGFQETVPSWVKYPQAMAWQDADSLQEMHLLQALGRQKTTRSRVKSPQEMTWQEADNLQKTIRSRVDNPQEMTWQEVDGLQEVHLSQAGGRQGMTRSRVNSPQDTTWPPVNDDLTTASSLAYSPRRKTRSRINSPQERARAMAPVAHRVNSPQYIPNQQL
ncbi:hypothetical protein DFQ26_009202 [Actinomortierella ambigua]|nr:hypothetical protein DFQ26_009202 [Actinomortierella ambigua]